MCLHYCQQLLVRDVKGGLIDDESVFRGVDKVLVGLLPAMCMASLRLLVVVDLDIGIVDLLH